MAACARLRERERGGRAGRGGGGGGDGDAGVHESGGYCFWAGPFLLWACASSASIKTAVGREVAVAGVRLGGYTWCELVELLSYYCFGSGLVEAYLILCCT